MLTSHKVVAVVVTYNRWDDLNECLTALQGQTRPPDHILVVDNGSTDGSRERVLELFPGVELYGARENVGGAGGFSFGVDKALAGEWDSAWLMDDDAEPTASALEELLAVQQANPLAPWWTSTTSFYEGTLEEGRAGQKLRAATVDVDRGDRSSLAREATFVGVLINLLVARDEPLPMADFFIWHDDNEYTSRLAREVPGVRALDSRIIHPYKAVYGDFGDRLRYDLRNRMWILIGRRMANPEVRRKQIVFIPKILVKQAVLAKSKSRYLKNLWIGLTEGLRRRPRSMMPGELRDSVLFEKLG